MRKELAGFDFTCIPNFNRSRILCLVDTSVYVAAAEMVIFVGKILAGVSPIWPLAWAWLPTARASKPVSLSTAHDGA
jgi:hypothetical protein